MMPIPQLPVTNAASNSTKGEFEPTNAGMAKMPIKAARLIAPFRPSFVSDARPHNTVPATPPTFRTNRYGSGDKFDSRRNVGYQKAVE
jgi:hypothetical protein